MVEAAKPFAVGAQPEEQAPESGGKRTVLVAVDNSPASERACQWAMKNLVRPGDHVHLMHVVETPATDSMIGTDVPGPIYSDPEHDRKRVEDAKSFVNAKFVPKMQDHPQVDVLPYYGAPGEALCDKAKELDADAVVMASHNKGPLARIFLGSTSNYCAKHCTQPLVITR